MLKSDYSAIEKKNILREKQRELHFIRQFGDGIFMRV